MRTVSPPFRRAMVSLPPPLGGAQAADIVPATRRVEHGPVAKDEAEREESLRGDAVVVVPLPRSGDVAGRAVADAAEDRALERHRFSEPPLEGGAERDGRARDTEDLRGYVVIAAVKSPYPSIGVARFVFTSEEEAADHDVLEGVVCVADSHDLKVEVIEGARIAIARLPREPIGHGEVHSRILPADGAQSALVIQAVVQINAEPQAPEGGRIIAREHGREALAEDEAVQAGGRR